MKSFLASATLLFAMVFTALAQQPAPPTQPPEKLKPSFEILQRSYPKVDAKKYPKAPADSVWQFRGVAGATGTVEVGFQGETIVYMVFRRGTGGAGWKFDEILQIHKGFHKELLKEQYCNYREGDKYRHELTPQINAAVIVRKDFDVKSLLNGS